MQSVRALTDTELSARSSAGDVLTAGKKQAATLAARAVLPSKAEANAFQLSARELDTTETNASVRSDLAERDEVESAETQEEQAGVPDSSITRRDDDHFWGDIGASWANKWHNFTDTVAHPIKHMKAHYSKEKEQLEQEALAKKQALEAKAKALANPVDTAQAKLDAKKKEVEQKVDKTFNTVTHPEETAEAALKKKQAEAEAELAKYKNAIDHPGQTAEAWLKPQLMAPSK